MSSARLMVRSANINVMCRAAEKAGRALVRDFNELEHLQVSRKSLGDFVSTADHRSEKILVTELQKARPDFGFLLEESGEIPAKDSDSRWIIDPLDGTTNFLHGIPHFAVSIGLQKGKEVIAGVIYNPITDELYWAEKGVGVYLNQRRLRVSGRKRLDESLIGIGSPYGTHGDPAHFARSTQKLLPFVAGVRRMGAASLDLAFVASGRYDAYFETHLQPWDIAAGILMVKEAGGYVSDLDGKDIFPESPSVLAANTNIFGDLSKLLKNV